jgi:hypothetical protein
MLQSSLRRLWDAVAVLERLEDGAGTAEGSSPAAPSADTEAVRDGPSPVHTAVFWHVATVGPLWRAVVREQYETLRASGLLDYARCAAEGVHWGGAGRRGG